MLIACIVAEVKHEKKNVMYICVHYNIFYPLKFDVSSLLSSVLFWINTAKFEHDTMVRFYPRLRLL